MIEIWLNFVATWKTLLTWRVRKFVWYNVLYKLYNLALNCQLLAKIHIEYYSSINLQKTKNWQNHAIKIKKKTDKISQNLIKITPFSSGNTNYNRYSSKKETTKYSTKNQAKTKKDGNCYKILKKTLKVLKRVPMDKIVKLAQNVIFTRIR